MTDHESQMNVIINGIKNSGLNAEDIQYCEAHGTGTYIGDSLEILGLQRVGLYRCVGDERHIQQS